MISGPKGRKIVSAQGSMLLMSDAVTILKLLHSLTRPIRCFLTTSENMVYFLSGMNFQTNVIEMISRGGTTVIGGTTLQFGTDIHGPQRMSSNLVSEGLHFPLISASCTLWLVLNSTIMLTPYTKNNYLLNINR